jgi:transposase
MDRFVLTDAQWTKIEPFCLGKTGDPRHRGKNNRLFVKAALWIARTGSPWRDLPPSFGHWNSITMRADKTDQSFASMIHLAAAVINSRWLPTAPSPQPIISR